MALRGGFDCRLASTTLTMTPTFRQKCSSRSHQADLRYFGRYVTLCVGGTLCSSRETRESEDQLRIHPSTRGRTIQTHRGSSQVSPPTIRWIEMTSEDALEINLFYQALAARLSTVIPRLLVKLFRGTEDRMVSSKTATGFYLRERARALIL